MEKKQSLDCRYVHMRHRREARLMRSAGFAVESLGLSESNRYDGYLKSALAPFFPTFFDLEALLDRCCTRSGICGNFSTLLESDA